MSDSAIAVVPNREHFDDAMQQQAFLLWMWECDSSFAQTAAKLLEQETWNAAVENRDPRKTPPADTLRYWSRKYDWPQMRHRVLLHDNSAGALYNQALGQLILSLPKAIERLLEIRDLPLTEPVLDRDGAYVGDKVSPSAVTGSLKAVELVLTSLRMTGRAANEQDGGPKLAPIREKRDNTNRTPEQIQKERMDRMKQLKKPRRGNKG